MQVEVVKWGNSSAVRLPAAVLKELHVALGDRLELITDEGKIVSHDCTSRAKSRADGALHSTFSRAKSRAGGLCRATMRPASPANLR